MSGWPTSPTPPAPYAFIQWKGTDACFDYYCTCGSQGHIDAQFAYFVRCPKCRKVWEMGVYVEMREATGEPRIDPVEDDL